MEITEYLNSSRLKRSEILKTAQAYIHKTTSSDLKLTIPETEELYAGPTPNRLKQFENEVGNQLKKIFRPEITETSQKLKKIITRSIDESIRKTYSSDKSKLKKKLLVMLPKGNNGCRVKIQNFVPHVKNELNIGEEVGEKIGRNWSKVSREIPRMRKLGKENFLLPVLSTAGSYKYRSDLYKF